MCVDSVFVHFFSFKYEILFSSQGALQKLRNWNCLVNPSACLDLQIQKKESKATQQRVRKDEPSTLITDDAGISFIKPNLFPYRRAHLSSMQHSSSETPSAVLVTDHVGFNSIHGEGNLFPQIHRPGCQLTGHTIRRLSKAASKIALMTNKSRVLRRLKKLIRQVLIRDGNNAIECWIWVESYWL